MQDVSLFLSQHAGLGITILVLLVLIMGMELLRLRQHQFRLTAHQATQFINKNNAVVIDIRPIQHYQQGHIISALLKSPQDIRQQPKMLDKFKSRPIIIICANGVESQKLAASLLKQGYNCYSLSNGIRSWTEANLPLIKD